MHPFFECSFSQGFWWAPGLKWNADLDINTMVGGQEQIPIGLSDGDHQHKMLEYMGLKKINTRGWSIWDQRNGAIL
jgi:hypothetical protein